MTYSINGQGANRTYVFDGSIGKYGEAKGNSPESFVVFGKNAARNLHGIIDSQGRQINNPEFVPVKNSEEKYSKTDDVFSTNFKMSLLANSREDLINSGMTDKNGDISLSDLNLLTKAAYGKNACSDAYDINQDGKVSADEMAVATVLADSLDEQDGLGLIDINRADGKTTSKGNKRANFMHDERNIVQNRALAKEIYEQLELDTATQDYAKITGEPVNPSQNDFSRTLDRNLKFSHSSNPNNEEYKMGLIDAAKYEMDGIEGKRDKNGAIDVKDVNKYARDYLSEGFDKNNIDFNVLDVNHDKKISSAEFAVFLAMADGSDGQNVSQGFDMKYDGTITDSGLNNAKQIMFNNESFASKADFAGRLFNKYGLGSAEQR